MTPIDVSSDDMLMNSTANGMADEDITTEDPNGPIKATRLTANGTFPMLLPAHPLVTLGLPPQTA